MKAVALADAVVGSSFNPSNIFEIFFLFCHLHASCFRINDLPTIGTCLSTLKKFMWGLD